MANEENNLLRMMDAYIRALSVRLAFVIESRLSAKDADTRITKMNTIIILFRLSFVITDFVTMRARTDTLRLIILIGFVIVLNIIRLMNMRVSFTFKDMIKDMTPMFTIKSKIVEMLRPCTIFILNETVSDNVFIRIYDMNSHGDDTIVRVGPYIFNANLGVEGFCRGVILAFGASDVLQEVIKSGVNLTVKFGSCAVKSIVDGTVKRNVVGSGQMLVVMVMDVTVIFTYKRNDSRPRLRLFISYVIDKATPAIVIADETSIIIIRGLLLGEKLCGLEHGLGIVIYFIGLRRRKVMNVVKVIVDIATGKKDVGSRVVAYLFGFRTVNIAALGSKYQISVQMSVITCAAHGDSTIVVKVAPLTSGHDDFLEDRADFGLVTSNGVFHRLHRGLIEVDSTTTPPGIKGLGTVDVVAHGVALRSLRDIMAIIFTRILLDIVYGHQSHRNTRRNGYRRYNRRLFSYFLRRSLQGSPFGFF